MNKNAKIYVAGHKGLVGSAIWKNLSQKGYTNLIGRTSAELDLRDAQAVAQFFKDEKPWNVKADLYIPCATQNEIQLEDAKNIVANGAKFVCEGANMPTTNEALKYLMDNGIIVGPAKAANAGGVACSAIEMSQNSRKMPMTPEEVYTQLESIMKNIHDNSAEASEKYGYGYNLVYGANIAGFLKVAEAMTAQGLV